MNKAKVMYDALKGHKKKLSREHKPAPKKRAPIPIPTLEVFVTNAESVTNNKEDAENFVDNAALAGSHKATVPIRVLPKGRCQI